MSAEPVKQITPAEAADEILRRRKAAKSLHEFAVQAWPQIEAGRPFKDNWHIGAIAEHLEAVARGQIRNLLVNQPPRTSKSSLIAVLFPAWLWIDQAHIQFLFASYAASLSHRDSRKCRALIRSRWYQTRWADRFRIAEDSDRIDRFDNDKSGYRIATSVDGTNTGEGAEILVFDDLNSVRDSSDASLDSTLEWWRNVMPTRMNDFKTSRRICVQQRTHEKDISGDIIANDDGDWVKLILPMEFEPTRRCITVPLPSTGGKIKWRDPRTKENELLDPNRIGDEELRRLKRELGSEYSIAGQLQQRPAPTAGGIIKRAWFKWWEQAEAPVCKFIIQSWDTSLTDTENSAYNAATTWGIFDDEHQIANMILLSMWRRRCEYHEVRKVALRMANHYLDDGIEPNLKLKSAKKPDLILIEDKGFGRLMIRDLQRAGVTAHGFKPDMYGDKNSRVRIASPILESGRVWLPAQAPAFTKLRPFADTFLEQMVLYPKSESRDLVDTVSQAIIRLIKSNFVWVAGDPGPEEPADNSNKVPFY